MNISKRFNKLILGGLIWLISVILIIAIAYFIPNINGALTSTYVAKYDTVYLSNSYNCYLIKDEKLVLAKNSGTTKFNFEEGSHVRKSQTVASVGKRNYVAQQAGLVSFFSDGYEDYFTESNLKNITFKDAEKLKISNNKLDKSTVARGEPIFKTVEDKLWYLVFWVQKDDVNQYSKNESVEVILDENNMVNAKISDVRKQDKYYMIVLKSIEYYPELATKRKIKADIVTVNQDGLLIKQKSIVTVDGNPGVYVKQLNGDYKFVRIKILTLHDENAIVASGSFSETVGDVTNNVTTIKSYDEILKNAKSMKKGGEKKDE